ncbi:hypothetical protein D9M68_818000 [compost metagenome]
MMFSICGPTVVPNLAINGIMAMVIIVPESLTESDFRTLPVALRILGLKTTPKANA